MPGAGAGLLPVTATPSWVRQLAYVDPYARVSALLKDRKITIDLTDAAKRWLGRVGYDPVYGARPLKRAVQRHVQDPLAERLLAGEIPDGAAVRID